MTDEDSKIIDIFFYYEEISEVNSVIIKGVVCNYQRCNHYDLGISLDCASITRLGKYQELFNSCTKTVNIDHHATNEQFAQIVKDSYSYAECLQKLGYKASSGSVYKTIKKKIDELQIDTSHFQKITATPRNRENIFVENSTCCQSVLRRWFLKENVEYKCSICGQEPFWNGKEMTMILDHINGKNNDDRLENLRWVCPNCNSQLDTTNGKNVKRYKKETNRCVDCGIEIMEGATRCKACYNNFKKSHPFKDMTRDELKFLIRTYSFVTIGKMYNISDNGIRKRCKKYGLPKTKLDIEKYSDSEWELL
jgi:DNA-directed RNA polymerase subunit RPC12/RpoP